ncbi:Bug family tripartite tricarboxylate transporter substrate binding protein [Jiella avicenniae]|uniref:Tripartite tricarboxylate transporter substrate binding protein n=1 Tax=Jiella avicenniae TaxID=2907202 RepID=A0A9X1T6Q7_9HYPH|nr:tripartite tricarboxylate transporter substrate binding protein [Jiella avicenniae]MCE7029620.1 tripartite tricarboxylate transporter substrate binding protein [Jiella avicenniae]
MKLTTVKAGLAALVLSTAPAFAEYPQRDIDLVVGFAAGGGTDVMARTVETYLEKHLGNGANIVVKNVPGASGQIGITEVAAAAPDGYTIGTYNLPGMMARTLDREPEYSADSFTFLANVVDDPNVIVTSKASGLESLDALIEKAKSETGAVTVSMSSLGGDDHLFLMKLGEKIGAEFTIVPFKGSAPARTALIGGHVDMAIVNVSEVANFADELNIIAVASEEESEYAPGTPTLKSLGVDIVNGARRGFVAPAGLPEEVETKLLEAFRQLENDEEFQAAMKETANPVDLTVGKDFRTLNDQQLELAKEVWEVSPWK